MAKIAIVDSIHKNTVGLSHYVVSLVEGLSVFGNHEYIIFHSHPELPEIIRESSNTKLLYLSKEKIFNTKIKRILSLMIKTKTNLDFIVKDYKPDIVILPSATLAPYHIKIPYIVVIHDMMHKYYPASSDITYFQSILRDIIFNKSTHNSIITVVDSDMTKKDLVRFYNLDEDKIRIIPYCPSAYISKCVNIDDSQLEKIRAKYNLPSRFIFYPAQFWKHKNHLRLLKAVAFIKEQYDNSIRLALAGCQTKFFEKVKSTVNEFNLSKEVIFLGEIPNFDLPIIYKASTALVYPSLFGPTNIPPLESMIVGTPVACSNLFSMPEQVGNAGLLFNPFDEKDIADKIYKLWRDKDLRDELSKRGLERVKEFSIEQFSLKWIKVIDEALQRIG